MTKKILIAEDQPDSRQLLEDILERFEAFGVVILTARDGVEAWEIAQKHTPNLILLDIMMPGINGYEVCKRVKAHPEMKDTYIIMVSAKTQADDRKQAALAGADEYVTKPFDLRLILERVQAVLDVKMI